MTARSCCVLLPRGRSRSSDGRCLIDHDALYQQAIAPALRQSGLTALRLELMDGQHLDAIFLQRILQCDVCLVDLSSGQEWLAYALGMRHASRAAISICLLADQADSPVRRQDLDHIAYQLHSDGQLQSGQAKTLTKNLANTIAERLRQLDDHTACDSPLLAVLGEAGPGLAELQAGSPPAEDDTIAAAQEQLAHLIGHTELSAKQRLEGLDVLRRQLTPFAETDSNLLVDLLLAYRTCGAWQTLEECLALLPKRLAQQHRLRQLRILTLRQLGKHEQAIALAQELLDSHGADPETLGLCGSAYKAEWLAQRQSTTDAKLERLLQQATDCYRRGFHADIRDPYPGINLATLLFCAEADTARTEMQQVLPVVRHAAQQRLQEQGEDYWHRATLLEAAILAGDGKEAERRCSESLALQPADWQCASTRTSLQLIADYRLLRGLQAPWLDRIIHSLDAA